VRASDSIGTGSFRYYSSVAVILKIQAVLID